MVATKLDPCIKALKAVTEKANLGRKFVRTLKELDLIETVLHSRKPNPKDNDKAALAFRPGLSEMYKTFPSLTALFVITAISIAHEKLQDARARSQIDVCARNEALLLSALNGLLDFIEAERSGENQTIVANALYPLLHKILFDSSNTPWPEDTTYLLYSLLIETVNGNVSNKTELRNLTKNGSYFYPLILQTKGGFVAIFPKVVSYTTEGFVSLEALLQLFTALLPIKKMPTERASFVENAFPAENFRSSAEIRTLLAADHPRTTGEELAIELLHNLASSDISYPQPFQVQDFKTNSVKSRPIHRVYVNHRGLLGNLELPDDAIDTVHVHYDTFKRVQIKAGENHKTFVQISLDYPPLVGATSSSPPGEGQDISISFLIKVSDKNKFVKALQSRGLAKDVLPQPIKLSTAESHLQLDFEPATADGPSLTQERARGISQLWENDACPLAGAPAPTSPLFSPPVLPKPIMKSPTPPPPEIQVYAPPAKVQSSKSTNFKPIGLTESIFGSSDDELTDVEDLDAVTVKAPLQVLSKGTTNRTSGRVSGKEKKPISLISDDEDAENPLIVESKHFKKSLTLPVATESLTLPKSNQSSKDPPKTSRGASVAIISPIKVSLDHPLEKKVSATSKKRKSNPDDKAEGNEGQISKKHKKTVKIEEMSSPVSKSLKPPTKRYGRKNRSSSPIPVYDDSPPRPARAATKKVTSKPAPRPVVKGTKKVAGADENVTVKDNSSKPKRQQFPTAEDSPPPKVNSAISKKPATKGTRSGTRSDKVKEEKQAEEKKPHAATEAPKADLVPIELEDSEPLPPKISAPSSPTLNPKQIVPQNRRSTTTAIYSAKKSNAVPWAEATPGKKISDFFPVHVTSEYSSPGPHMAQREDITLYAGGLEHVDTPLFDWIPEPVTMPVPAIPDESKQEKMSVKASTPRQNEVGISPDPCYGQPPRIIRKDLVSEKLEVSATKPFYSLPRPPKTYISPATRYLPSPSFDASYEHERPRDPGLTNTELKTVRLSPEPGAASPVREVDIPEIVDVIQEITQVIITNTSKRFTNVRKEIKTAQSTTIKEITREFEKIQLDSTEWAERLGDIQADYASEHMKISHEWDVVKKATAEIKALLDKTMSAQNRRSMSKKFPKKLIQIPIPNHVLHPKISY